MTLETLALEGFRNLQSAELHWHPETNLILGANAAGKTGLLEAIHFLGRFRSFRTSRKQSLIQQGREVFRLFGTLSGTLGRHRVGMEVSAHAARIRLDGRELHRRSALVELMPLQLLNQDAHLLIEAGPEHRRHFLDWGVFHVEPAYREVLARYQRLLRQRNAALRQGLAAREIQTWDPEFIETASAIDSYRSAYVAELLPMLKEILDRLMDMEEVELDYRRGWPTDKSLEALLREQVAQDRERAFTFSGPHRADLGIRIAGRSARDRLSRGQQKLLVSGLVLAQLRHFCARTARSAILLVDDLPAELDEVHRKRLFEHLQELPVQRFVTAIEPSQLPELLDSGEMFHVEHGQVRNMVYS